MAKGTANIQIDSEYVQEVIRLSGKTLAQMAEEMGHSRSYLYNVVRRGEMAMADIRLLALLTGVKEDRIMAVKTEETGEQDKPGADPEAINKCIDVINQTVDAINSLDNAVKKSHAGICDDLFDMQKQVKELSSIMLELVNVVKYECEDQGKYRTITTSILNKIYNQMKYQEEGHAEII